MYPTRPDNKKQKAVASFVVILAIVILTGGVGAYKEMKGAPQTTTSQVSNLGNDTSTPTTTSSGSTAPSSTARTSFKDGTYTASSDYYVPHGVESIKVTLTVKGGVVTGSQIANSEGDPESASFQQDFASSYKSYVVGKNLSDIRLSYVAGASDTTQGFNDALRTITKQAQA